MASFFLFLFCSSFLQDFYHVDGDYQMHKIWGLKLCNSTET